MNLRGQLHNTDFEAFELAFIYIHSVIDKMINDYLDEMTKSLHKWMLSIIFGLHYFGLHNSNKRINETPK